MKADIRLTQDDNRFAQLKKNPGRPQTPPSAIGSHDSLLLSRFYKIQYGQPKPSKEELLREIRLGERQAE